MSSSRERFADKLAAAEDWRPFPQSTTRTVRCLDRIHRRISDCVLDEAAGGWLPRKDALESRNDRTGENSMSEM